MRATNEKVPKKNKESSRIFLVEKNQNKKVEPAKLHSVLGEPAKLYMSPR